MGALCLVHARVAYGVVRLSEIMTSGVVTAGAEASALEVARLMRDHRVGSVVIVDPAAKPVAMLTDRDLALRVFAEGVGARRAGARARLAAADLRRAGDGARRGRGADGPAPGAPASGRRGEELVGIVSLDDIAVRSGNLEVAQKMTQDVIEGALPQFYFHERG